MTWRSEELSDSQWQHLEEAVRRLEEAWHVDSQPNIDSFITGLEPDVRTAALVECIKVDLEYHWRTTRPAFVESYVERWPELQDTAACLLELLKWECMARATFSMPATADELHRRFGELSGSIDLSDIESKAVSRPPPNDSVNVNSDPTHVTNKEHHAPVYLPLTMGQTFGRYKIRGQLGEGGEGNVYCAYDRQMDRDVALKFPRHADRELLDRFLRESLVAAKLEHRNICRIYDAGTVGGVNFIAMALIRGETIQERLDRLGVFDCDEAVSIVRSIALASECVHQAGVIHRDIKSANIMIDLEDEPILMDFGLARPIDKSVGMTTTAAFAGTLAFMSPEAAGGQSIDQRGDIYSLGVVLYHMLTGQVPFSLLPAELLRHLGKSPAPSPRKVRPEVPATLDDICRRAMAPRPEDRYPSAGELADALRRHQDGLAQIYKPPRTHRSRLLVPVLAVLLCAAVAIPLFWPGHSPTHLGSSGDNVEVQNNVEVQDNGEVQIAGQSDTPKLPAEAKSPRLPEPVPQDIGQWIDTPENILACAITKDGKRAFVADYTVDSVCLIREFDLTTGEELAKPITISDFQGGYDLLLSPDDQHLYVTSYYSNHIIDIHVGADGSQTPIQIISGEKMADRVWWRWANRLQMTADGTKIVIPMGHDDWPDQEPDPEDPNSRRSQRARTANDQVSIIDMSVTPPRLIKEIPLEDEPVGDQFCISRDSRYAYIATQPRPSSENAKLYQIELTDPYQARRIEIPNGKLAGVQISDRLGKLYLLDRAHRKIWIVDTDTFSEASPSEFFHLNGRAPTSLLVDDKNSLLAVICADSRSCHFLDLIDGRILARVEGLRVGCCASAIVPASKCLSIISSGEGAVGLIPVPEFEQKIAFSSNRGGGTEQIYTMDPDGTNVSLLLEAENHYNERHPRWSPSGDMLAFLSDRDVVPRICLVKRGEKTARPIPSAEPELLDSFDWSPDGRQIIYVDRDRKTLNLLDVESETVTCPGIKFPSPYLELGDLCWARNGDLYVLALPIRNAALCELFRVDVDSASVEQLTFEADTDASCRRVAVSRNGDIAVCRGLAPSGSMVGIYRLLLGQPMENAFVQSANANTLVSYCGNLDWFPDAQMLLFHGVAAAGGGQVIGVADPETGSVSLLTNGQFHDASPNMSVRFPDPYEMVEAKPKRPTSKPE